MRGVLKSYNALMVQPDPNSLNQDTCSWVAAQIWIWLNFKMQKLSGSSMSSCLRGGGEQSPFFFSVYILVFEIHSKIIQAAEKKWCHLATVRVKTGTEVNDGGMLDEMLHNLPPCERLLLTSLICNSVLHFVFYLASCCDVINTFTNLWTRCLR